MGLRIPILLISLVGNLIFAKTPNLTQIHEFDRLTLEEKYFELRFRSTLNIWGKNREKVSWDEKLNDFYQLSEQEGFAAGKLMKTLGQVETLLAQQKREEAKPLLLQMENLKASDEYLDTYKTYIRALNTYFLKDFDRTMEILNDGLKVLTDDNDWNRYRLNILLINCHYLKGDLDKVIAVTKKNLELGKYHKSGFLQRQAQYNLGRMAKSEGKIAQAMDYYISIIENDDFIDEVYFHALNSIAVIKMDLNKYNEALAYYHKILKVIEDVHVSVANEILIYSNMSVIYRDAREFEKAYELTNRAIKLSAENKDFRNLIYNKLRLIDILVLQDKYKEAESILDELNEIDEKHWEIKSLGWREMNYAKIYRKKHNYKKSAFHVENGIKYAQKSNLNHDILAAYEEALRIYQGLKNYRKLYEYHKIVESIKDQEEKEKNSELLYEKENRLLAAQNAQHELIRETEQVKSLAFFGFGIFSIIVVLLQFNRYKVITHKNEKLRIKEAIVREKTRDLRSILDNINQGVVTITYDEGGDLVIKESSAHVNSILNLPNDLDLLNEDPIKKIFQNSDLPMETVGLINSVLVTSIEEDEFQWEINADQLPYEMNLPEGNKVIELDWSVITQNEVIVKILLTLKDVTELRRLANEQKNNETNIKKLISLSLMEQREYFILMDSIQKLIDEVNDVLNKFQNFDQDVIDTSFRNLHTIKGLARSYQLNLLSNFVHEIEDFFQKVRSRDIVYSQSELIEEIETLQLEVESYRKLAKEKLKWEKQSTNVSLPTRILTKWYDDISENLGNLDERENWSQLLRDIKKRYSTSFRDSLREIILSSEKLGRDLGKGKIEFNLTGVDPFLNKSSQEFIYVIFVHLIRNSVDHGLYTIEERERFGLDSPMITIDVGIIKDGYKIYVFDNGRGLNLESLKEKSMQTNFDYKDDSELPDIIFKSGVSTKKEISEISGRGVGLDAVRDFLHKIGGEIKIEPRSAVQDGYLPFRFAMQLPGSFFD